MKEEKKKDDDFEVDPIITLIALIGVVITMIFCFINSGFPDNWCVYTLCPVVLYFVYRIGLYLLVGIIGLLIAFIMCLFEKINKKIGE